jgi:hypothetical protein
LVHANSLSDGIGQALDLSAQLKSTSSLRQPL